MNQRRSLGITAVVLGLALVAGCRSFEESVRPLITPQAPPGYTPPVYMTGTISASQADPEKMNVQVWRVNSTPYPDSVLLYVRVFDTDGKLVTNLAPPYYTGADDYRRIWSGLSEQIGLDGKPQNIENFTVREFSDQDGIPYELALVLDYSGTMGTNIDMLETGAAAFVKLKRQQDRIAVVKFDKTPQLVVRSTNSEKDLLATFNRQGLAGYGTYTALYGAAKLGAEQVALGPKESPRAVVLFTDGEDNASTIVATDLYKYCLDNNIPIFTIAFGPVNQEILGDISTVTGGKFYQTYTADELKMAFEDIYRSLRNYYQVSYTPPNVAGRHIATLTLRPPRSGRNLGATAEYNTLTGAVITASSFDPGPIFFDYNQASIRSGSQAALDAVASIMKERPRLRIEVRGHTDATGGEEYNQKLSEERAMAVRTALISLGVEEGRIRARGFGMSQPVATNETEEGRAKNRRTEFVVLVR